MRWALLLLLVVACGCKKETQGDPYYIDYKEGREYELIFYISNIHQNSFTQIHYVDMTSVDNRMALINTPMDSPLAPTNLTKPDLEETDDLKLYQVAEIKFIWGRKGPIEEVYTKTRDWHWVYGRVEDYKFPNGSVHQRIEIVGEVE